jgi:hypothetical protein
MLGIIPHATASLGEASAELITHLFRDVSGLGGLVSGFRAERCREQQGEGERDTHVDQSCTLLFDGME